MDYFDEKGIPQLKLSYCVFIDVLGFNQRMEDSFNNGEGKTLFREFYSTISKEIEELKEGSDDLSFYLKAFTDNIVIGFPLSTEDGESEFGFTIISIMLYQLAMALEGYFIRGGLAIGQLFMDENIVYGPAIIEAYNIESKISKDPRITLSSDILKIVKEHTKYYAEPIHSPQNSSILIDVDGQAFTNYLEMLMIDLPESRGVDWKHLNIHKEQIMKGLSEYKNNPHIWAKYFWLANYHNYFCDSVSEVIGFNNAYMIPEIEIRRFPTKLI